MSELHNEIDGIEDITDLEQPSSFSIMENYAGPNKPPSPPQLAFHGSGAKYRLAVGGMGSGKSLSLLWEAIIVCLDTPGCNALIIRRTVPDLKRSVIDKFLAQIPKHLYKFFHQGDHICYFHNGSKLYMGATERVEDVGKWLSTEFLFIGFEELGEHPYGVWEALRERNRCPIPGTRATMAGATNPFGRGWDWIQKLWVHKKPLRGMTKYDPKDYEYFKSTVFDNPAYKDDKEYIDALAGGSAPDIRLYGNLEGVAGTFFSNFEPKHHVRRREEFTFLPYQSYAIGWDYGFGHWATIVFITKARTKFPIINKKNPSGGGKTVNVVTREIYLTENTPKQQVEALIASIPRNEQGGFREQIEQIYFSWERFNRTTSQYTVADEVGDLLSAAGLPRPQRESNKRVDGWMRIYQLFDEDELFILDNCEVLAEAIPTLVRSKTNIEDVEKPKGVSLEDDIADALRYAVAGWLMDPDEKPRDMQMQEEVAGLPDALTRHFKRKWIEKKYQDEAKGLSIEPQMDWEQ